MKTNPEIKLLALSDTFTMSKFQLDFALAMEYIRDVELKSYHNIAIELPYYAFVGSKKRIALFSISKRFGIHTTDIRYSFGFLRFFDRETSERLPDRNSGWDHALKISRIQPLGSKEFIAHEHSSLHYSFASFSSGYISENWTHEKLQEHASYVHQSLSTRLTFKDILNLSLVEHPFHYSLFGFKPYLQLENIML